MPFRRAHACFDADPLKCQAKALEKTLSTFLQTQRLVLHSYQARVLYVPISILPQIFQRLSYGVIGLVDAHKGADILHLFPHAQVSLCCERLHPASHYLIIFAGCMAMKAFRMISHDAAEIEMP